MITCAECERPESEHGRDRLLHGACERFWPPDQETNDAFAAWLAEKGEGVGTEAHEQPVDR